MTGMQGFGDLKNRAINEMWDMNRRAAQNGPKTTKLPLQNNGKAQKNFVKNFGLSFSDDDILIMGLLLILAEDCHDTWLFLALLYILM